MRPERVVDESDKRLAVGVAAVAGGGHRVRAKDGYAWEFDAGGRLTRMTDTSGNATTMVYTGALLTAVNDSSGAVALTLAYTGNKLTQVTDRAGRTVRFGFTGDDLTSAEDVLGKVERYGYDSRHLLTSRTDRRGQVWRSFFDGFRRWTASLPPDGAGAHATYNVLQLTTVYFDKRGEAWRSVHNAAGNPVEQTNPLGETTRSTWLAQERTTLVDGRGFQTVMTYDVRGNVLTRTHPDGRVDTHTYEPTFSRMLTHRYTYAESRPTMGSDPTGKVFSLISPRTSGLLASLAVTAQLRHAVEDLLFSPTASRLVRAVHSSATVFRLQNQALGYNASGGKRFGQTGHPMDAHRDSCDGTVKVDISIDLAAPDIYLDSLNGTQQAIVGVSPAQPIFADLRLTVAHELMHALQYISATEKYDPFIFPDPDLTLLLLQMKSEPVYVGPESPPKVESAISDQHLPNRRLPADASIYSELNE